MRKCRKSGPVFDIDKGLPRCYHKKKGKERHTMMNVMLLQNSSAPFVFAR